MSDKTTILMNVDLLGNRHARLLMKLTDDAKSVEFAVLLDHRPGAVEGTEIPITERQAKIALLMRQAAKG